MVFSASFSWINTPVAPKNSVITPMALARMPSRGRLVLVISVSTISAPCAPTSVRTCPKTWSRICVLLPIMNPVMAITSTSSGAMEKMV